MSVLTDEARAALTAGHLAHLTTLGRDGAPHVTVVWIGLEGDEVVSAHLGRYQKVRNVERDPRVAISLLTGGRNPIGLDLHLIIYGHARVTEGGAPQLLQRLARTYLGPDVLFPPMPDPPPGFILRTTPSASPASARGRRSRTERSQVDRPLHGSAYWPRLS